MPESNTDSTLLCQSCGMPLAAAEHFGTNSDNTPSQEYCCFCFEKGRFTDRMDLPDKIAGVVAYHDESEKEEGRTLTRNELSVRLHLLYPGLKRWKNHDNCHTAYYEAVNRALEYVNNNLAGKIPLKKTGGSCMCFGFSFSSHISCCDGRSAG